MKDTIKRIPIVGDLAKLVYRRLSNRRPSRSPFPGSEVYWEKRYATGGDPALVRTGTLLSSKPTC